MSHGPFGRGGAPLRACCAIVNAAVIRTAANVAVRAEVVEGILDRVLFTIILFIICRSAAEYLRFSLCSRYRLALVPLAPLRCGSSSTTTYVVNSDALFSAGRCANRIAVLGAARRLLHGALQFDSGSESRDAFGFDQEMAAAAGIVDTARFAVRHAEAAETGESD